MSQALVFAKEIRVYQPIPFPEYDGVTADRTDCIIRYQVIQDNYGSFKGKTIYDLCSANCFFGFRFLQDGGKSVVAVEKDDNTRKFVNTLAKEKGLILDCEREPLLEEIALYAQADIGLYLDTHYSEGTQGYPEHMKKMVRVVFTSSCERQEDYKTLLQSLFPNVEKIYKGFQERVIYKCW